MSEVINENHLQCGEVEQVSVNENLQQFTNSLNLYQIAQQTNDSEDMKRMLCCNVFTSSLASPGPLSLLPVSTSLLVKEAMQAFA
eukprot:g59107.t1